MEIKITKIKYRYIKRFVKNHKTYYSTIVNGFAMEKRRSFNIVVFNRYILSFIFKKEKLNK